MVQRSFASFTSTRLLALVALAALAGGRTEASPDGPEPEAKAVARLAKGFARLQGYAATVEVAGGTATGTDHRISSYTVNGTYRLDVSGRLCRIEGPVSAWRLRDGAPEGGAVRDGAQWKGILAVREGRECERLVVRPEQVLAQVAGLKKLARWVAPTQEPPGFQPPHAAAPPAGLARATLDDDAEADAPRPAAAAGTRARDDGKAPASGRGQAAPAAEAAPPPSHHLRIEGPPQVALETFTQVVNSGCLDAG